MGIWVIRISVFFFYFTNVDAGRYFTLYFLKPSKPLSHLPSIAATF